MNDTPMQMRLPCVRTLVLPKIHSAQDLHHVSEEIYLAYRAHKYRNPDDPPVQLVASIESAKAMYNLGEIASWQSRWGAATGGKLAALLVRTRRVPLPRFPVLSHDAQFAAEDCEWDAATGGPII